MHGLSRFNNNVQDKFLEGRWSRRITKKHRLVYRIYENNVVVLVLRAYGHYDDK